MSQAARMEIAIKLQDPGKADGLPLEDVVSSL
jgi:hypothetical protein